MKKLFFTFLVSLVSVQFFGQAPVLNESGGWLESAFVKWTPVTGADSYNVYYTGMGITNRKIDTQLIRSYGTYFRADVLGLQAGNYTLKVVPVISGEEGDAAETTTIEVLPHDRNGFAFANGRVPGAYKANGTPKDNAVIIYITQNTKNTVSMDVTGANANPCVGLQAILDGFKKGSDFRPLIVRLVGQVTDPAEMYNGDIVVENKNNAASFITIEGVGDDAVVDGWGIRIKNASNIELRNFGSMNVNSSEGDNISLQQENDYVWVHNLDLFYGDAGSDADQIKGDGAMDVKRSTYVTVSYNHFWDSGKSNLLGLSEGTTSGLFITYHHNWYDHSDSRHPRVRFYSAHVYNNYYDGISKYGVGSTEGSSVFVEANYFRNCKYPMLISMQGSDVYDTSKQANDYSNMPTFSKEDGGIIKAFNNYMVGQRRFVPYGADGFPNPAVDFDAYVAQTRNETVPPSVMSNYGKNTYNNFDTNPSVMYAYSPDSPDDAKDKVMLYAGRVMGGDFKWTFNNAVDDTSYDVIAALKSALTGYKTKLVSVQGDGDNNNGGEDPGGNEPAEGDMVHNFTLSGKTSSFYSITGNLSTSYGTVNYAGITLTQCLKIESSTSISFTTTQRGTLTLVFNSAYSGSVKIGETTYTPASGIVSHVIDAGTYTITKGSGSNYLFFMSVVYETTGIVTDKKSGDTSNVKIFPNPAVNQVFVTSDVEIKKIEVYNLTGVKVKMNDSFDTSIDISDLNRGTYFVKVFTKEGNFMQKLIKE